MVFLFFQRLAIFVAFAAAVFISPFVIAKEMPYYASIKSDDANIRTGPSVRYPIQWIYKRKNLPVQVTAAFERWRKISDTNGEIGWIHESLLSNRRFGMIKADGMLEVYRSSSANSNKVFIVENGVIAEIKECKNEWCKISVEHKDGWVKQQNLWGVGKGEVVE